MNLVKLFNKIPTIETERFILREILISDAKDLYEYYHDDQVTKYLDWYGPDSVEHAEEIIKCWNKGFNEGWIIRWAIATKENNKIIGTIFYNGFRDGLICEIGYELSQAYWRKGVMTEIFKHLLPIAYFKLGINRLQAIVDPENIASIQLLKKIGFQEEGLLRDYEVHGVTNNCKDMIMLSLLKREFLQHSREVSTKDFLDSLDLIDQEMEEYISYALQDLWELGSIPEYIYLLIDKNVDKRGINKIIDFGCGKGAVLIYLAARLDFQGIGIDIMPEFIESANQHAIETSVNSQIDFKTGDILNYIEKEEKYDVVIYGYDSGILGDVKETILQLKNCIQDSGYLILEIAFTADSKNKIEGLPTEKELIEQFEESGLNIIDKILWDVDRIAKINEHNNKFISNRIQELMVKYPAKKQIFEQYMVNQINECKLIEYDMICSTWILKK